jgi:hypothetical protein
MLVSISPVKSARMEAALLTARSGSGINTSINLVTDQKLILW